MLSRLHIASFCARFASAATLTLFYVAAGSLTQAHAQSFQPVIDEFWIIKNGQEIFRDAFSDGLLPPSGPDGASTYSTAATAGLDGMTSESGGKLTMTPAFGSQTLITSTLADTFTSGLRANTTSTDPSVLGSLLFADAFEVHAIYDLSEPGLPTISGQGFGIAIADRFLPTNEGNDEVRLLVGRSSMTGDLGVAFRDLSLTDDTTDVVDFDSIEGLLPFSPSAQIELMLSKAANSNLVFASWSILGGAWTVMDNINNVTLLPVSIYNGEDYARARFFSLDTNVNVAAIPEPEIYAMMGIGLGFVGWIGRRRRRIEAA